MADVSGGAGESVEHRLHSCDDAARCARPGECSSPNPFNDDEGTCAVGHVGVWPPPCCWECHRCDGEGRERVEVIFNGDQSYPDVQDCPECEGTGEQRGLGRAVRA